MKKIFLLLSVFSILICLLYVNAGWNSWTQDLTNATVWQDCIVFNSQNPAIMYAGTNGSGVYKTTNAGANWVLSNNGLTVTTIWALAISKTNPNLLLAGTSNTGSTFGVFRTTDGAASWAFSNTGITQSSPAIQAFAFDPTNANNVYVGVWDGSTTINASDGLYKSTTGGASWFVSNTGMGADKNILCIAINPRNPNTVYCGTSFIVGSVNTGPTFVYKSYDAGATWASFSTGLPTGTTEINPVRTLSISDLDTSVVLAGLFQNTTSGGAFLTTNGGALWTRIQNSVLITAASNNIRAAKIRPGSSTEFYLGIDGSVTPPGGVYRTTNRGTSWVDFNGGPMSNTYVVRALNFRTGAFSGDSTLYAGAATGSPGVFEYTFAPVGISNNGRNIPKDFMLRQNYPNPFNPTTLIIYDLPKEANVSLSVYDVSGRLVKNLVKENEVAGTYYLNFDASSLSSGIYFYKLTAGNFVQTKKMILVK